MKINFLLLVPEQKTDTIVVDDVVCLWRTTNSWTQLYNFTDLQWQYWHLERDIAFQITFSSSSFWSFFLDIVDGSSPPYQATILLIQIFEMWALVTIILCARVLLAAICCSKWKIQNSKDKLNLKFCLQHKKLSAYLISILIMDLWCWSIIQFEWQWKRRPIGRLRDWFQWKCSAKQIF